MADNLYHRAISREISPPPSVEIKVIEPTQIPTTFLLDESVTSMANLRKVSADCSPDVSIDCSPMNCNGYSSANSTHSESSSKSKCHSILFPCEESQSGQLHIQNQPAKESQQYRKYPTLNRSRRRNLLPKTPSHDEDNDDHIMAIILTNHKKQESMNDQLRSWMESKTANKLQSPSQTSTDKTSTTSSMDTRKRAGADPSIPASPSVSKSTFLVRSSQSNLPVALPMRISEWQNMTDSEELTSTSPGEYINSTTDSYEDMNRMYGSMRQSHKKSATITISPKHTRSRALIEPEFLLDVSYEESDSGSDDDFDDDKEQEDILEVVKIKFDHKQTELSIQRTIQLLMISNRKSKELFQSLLQICLSLKKDPTYHISFDDKLLKHDHVETFLRLLGFLKDKSLSQWSCFAHTRVPISLINTTILEFDECRKIRHRRGTTVELVKQYKQKRKNSTAFQMSELNVSILKQSQSVESLSSSSSTLDSIENEDDISDSLQLYELIWSITHNNNEDRIAKDVLLLCYPLVTNAKRILKCLQNRFFRDDHDGRNTISHETAESDRLSPDMKTSVPQNSSMEFGKDKMKYDRILSSFRVQWKVIDLIRYWMERFWDKDWESDAKLMSYCEIFMRKIRKAYQSQDNQEYYDASEIEKGLRLVELVEQSIKMHTSQSRIQQTMEIFGESENDDDRLSLQNNDSGYTKGLSIFFRQKKIKMGPKNLMDINYVVIAEQLTLLQFNIFKKIHPRECLKQAWKKEERKHRDAPTITKYIEVWNQLTKWIQSSILEATDVKSRGKTIKKWVKVAERLLKLRNFQGLCAVYAGLATSAIYRLKDAWSYVPKKHRAQHERIRVIMKTDNNWKNLRSLELQTNPPMLPYFGMFAQDMIVVEETTNNRRNDGSINWDALCRCQATIDKHLMYQNKPYENLNTDLLIQRWMNEQLTMSGKLDDEVVYQCSKNVASNDKREARKSLFKFK